MARTREEINQTEKDYWNEKKLDRSKIKKLRRHAFFFSYKREKKTLDRFLEDFNGKNVLEIGSYTWATWFHKNTIPKNNLKEKNIYKDNF